jgi:hypothetical protein
VHIPSTIPQIGKTLHLLLLTPNVGVRSLSASSFSADSSLLACGFSESYIRLWNLKGEKLKGMRSDFQESSVKDGMY